MLIDWYVEVIEGGHDTKQVIKDLAMEKKRTAELTQTLEDVTNKYERENRKLKRQLQEAYD